MLRFLPLLAILPSCSLLFEPSGASESIDAATAPTISCDVDNTYVDLEGEECGPALTIVEASVLDTTEETLTLGQGEFVPLTSFVLQGSPDALVVLVSSLEISSSGELAIRGERPLILVSAGDVKIRGVLTASRAQAQLAPLLDGVCAGNNGSQSQDPTRGNGGGSGGGFGSSGAAGGEGAGNITGGQEHQALPAPPATLLPGCPGGNGAPKAGNTGNGGEGGGALALISGESLSITGTVTANGAGGNSGQVITDRGGSGGGGGGSGGMLVFVAKELHLSQTAKVTAMGGGGGGGGDRDQSGDPGLAGAVSEVGAPGGVGPDRAGNGGSAAGKIDEAQPGEDGFGPNEVSGTGGGGGGGGGVGFILFESTSQDVDGSALISPAALDEI